jgi:cytochrome o ubiquinol oxidase subunit 1
VSTFSRKRLFGYESLVYATAAIGVLSFTVWLHHFFTMGSSAGVNAFFGVMTMIIAVPTGVKIFNWLLTMFRGRIEFHPSMMWSIAFMVTFVIGGMTGVLLAIPPADYLMHNTTFLIAHFHNMIIPGVLFGYLAGYMYWFPKAFGFAFDRKWGLGAFWCWTIGFYLAFMPLYLLGLKGMPRRMENYNDPTWQPYLMVAALGAVIVLCGIGCMVMQLYVSIRDRNKTRDLTGDPYNGRTLEWSTSSPPPAYNFAVIPTVNDREPFLEMKEKGIAYQRPANYEPIRIPSNTPIGVILGAFGFVLGFAIVWHIWWLVVVSGLVMFAAVIVRSSNDEQEFTLSAAEVKAIEDERFRMMGSRP